MFRIIAGLVVGVGLLVLTVRLPQMISRQGDPFRVAVSTGAIVLDRTGAVPDTMRVPAVTLHPTVPNDVKVGEGFRLMVVARVAEDQEDALRAVLDSLRLSLELAGVTVSPEGPQYLDDNLEAGWSISPVTANRVVGQVRGASRFSWVEITPASIDFQVEKLWWVVVAQIVTFLGTIITLFGAVLEIRKEWRARNAAPVGEPV
jgi:hypothetical protein